MIDYINKVGNIPPLNIPTCINGTQIYRRQQRKIHGLMNPRSTLEVIKNILDYLIEIENENTENEIKYYSYSPYYTSEMDEFCSASYKKNIGIKTKLYKKSHINLGLQCLYLIKNNVKLGSDEIVFERHYLMCVPVRDENSLLSLFISKILLNYSKQSTNLLNLLNRCLNNEVFEDNVILQCKLWLLTFNNRYIEMNGSLLTTTDKDFNYYSLKSIRGLCNTIQIFDYIK